MSTSSDSSCPRCFDVKQIGPLILAATLALFCTSCVLAHVLVYCRERGEARQRAIKRQRDDDGSILTEPESAFSCASFSYYSLHSAGFILLVVAAWQHRSSEEGANIILVAIGAALVALGLLLCGWFVRRGDDTAQDFHKKDDEVPTDEESLEEDEQDVEKGRGSSIAKAPSSSSTVKVMLKRNDTEAEMTLADTETTVAGGCSDFDGESQRTRGSHLTRGSDSRTYILKSKNHGAPDDLCSL